MPPNTDRPKASAGLPQPAKLAEPVHITPNAHTPAPHPGDIYRRLGRVALIYATVYFIAHLAEIASGSFDPVQGFSFGKANLVALVCILSGLAVFLLAWTRKLDPHKMLAVGLGFEVIAAAGIDLFLTWIPINGGALIGVSWVTVWIICFALVIPAAPAQTLFGSLGAATMTPILFGIAVLRGVSEWNPLTMFLLSFPNYVCVGVAWFSSRVIYDMRKEVSAARAMGSYRLVEPLGQGGMGEVWRAEHHRLARPAAIKLIRPDMIEARHGAAAASLFQRFEREAQVTATLESAHTVRLYDFGISDDGSFYYVMELLRGLDLQRLVERFGALPPARAVHLLRQACHSLGEAHSRGMIHRDVKPGNLHIGRSGQDYDFIKVLDFGLAKALSPGEDDLALTQTGSTTGTPAYLAPELALGKAEADGRADIYSLGCVGYWLLTGHLVFQAATPFEMAMHHVQKAPLPPSQVCETGIPHELDAVILACLEKEPGRRPRSMADLSERLLRIGSSRWSPEEAQGWWHANVPDLSIENLPKSVHQ